MGLDVARVSKRNIMPYCLRHLSSLLFSGLLMVPAGFWMAAGAAAAPTSPASATRNVLNSQRLAQSLVGQCRQTNRRERVYEAADLASDWVGDLAVGARVTLAGNVNEPTFGWIQISQPARGYIQAAFLTPCQPVTTQAASTMQAAQQALDGTSWRLVRWGAFDTMKMPVEGASITAAFTGDRVSGSGGCNQYNGAYQGTEHILSFGPIAATRRACESPISDLEMDYFKALDGVQSYEITPQEQLTMLYLVDGKAGLMVFEPQ